ncbi:MAG: hypothetical protein AAB967_02605 [Patescibacteria group bacterium]
MVVSIVLSLSFIIAGGFMAVILAWLTSPRRPSPAYVLAVVVFCCSLAGAMFAFYAGAAREQQRGRVLGDGGATALEINVPYQFLCQHPELEVFLLRKKVLKRTGGCCDDRFYIYRFSEFQRDTGLSYLLSQIKSGEAPWFKKTEIGNYQGVGEPH